MRPHPRLIRTLALVFLMAGGAAPLQAQFGRNRVQYDTFKFDIIKTEHFDIYYYKEEEEAAAIAARLAERWYARLSRVLNHELRSRQTVILYASGPHFRQTNVVGGGIDEGVGGVTESLKRRVVMPFAGPLAETDHVLGHELIHAFQYDLTTAARNSTPGVNAMPLWFVEGMAEYLSLGPDDAHTAMWIRDASRHKLPEVRNLERAATPYRYGHAFWGYVGGRWGDEMVGAMLRSSMRMGIENAMLGLLKVKEKELSVAWHNAIHEAYDSLRPLTTEPDSQARLLFGKSGDYDFYNLAPALSPDGKQMAFLAVRDLFAIEMYLADVATGKVTRKIVKTATDPHFESLQFINSAGAFSPDGRRFALGGIVGGDPSLTVIDIESGDRVHEAKFADLGEVFTPTWSPDGERIAFSAIVGGLTDLYVYEPGTERLIRLTNDPFADMQPAWSPDGRSIAFVTDRFSTNLDNLAFGDYQLGLIDPSGDNIRPIPAFPKGKHINPQWGPGGTDLFFVSDQNGISNAYRLNVASGALTQITNVFSGISGITDLSPSIAVATNTGDVAFSVFEKDAYSIYLMSATTAAAGTPPRPIAEVTPAMLPPQDRAAGPVMLALADAETGLPIDSAFAQRPYSTKLTLDGVSRPSVAVGVDQFGTLIGGGAALYFSDMLGEHHLISGLEVYGSLKDVAASMQYYNLKRRLNWGGTLQQIPYQSIGYQPTFVESPNGPIEIDSIYRFRQTNRSLGGMLSYPFSRVQRVDLSASFVNIDYSADVDVEIYSLATGQLLDRTSEGVDLNLPSVNMATTSLALVYDNSFYGATAPVLGQRWRIEASPAVGSLTWLNLLGDFRRYFMPFRPFTFAFRALHFGRYGSDAESGRLSPLYLGYGSLVRGYHFNSFSTGECSGGSGGCDVFTRLIGSKIAVANAEIRFPLLGTLGIGEGFYGFFPIDMVFFGDAGLAWTSAEKPWFADGTRRPVYSAGSAIRVNLFGFVAEVSLAHPFNRGKNWIWQLNLQPGF